jgi:hypothetical protein
MANNTSWRQRYEKQIYEIGGDGKSSLQSSRRMIRLVVLLQGYFDDPIRCRLAQVCLDEEITYDALSYRWGDPNDRLPILVNGFPFQATRGLVTALRCLRRGNEDMTLWIDAICINQDNIEERNEQVFLMFDIYSRARLVRAWVGADIESDDGPEAERVFLPRIESEQQSKKSGKNDGSTYGGNGWTVRKLVDAFGSQEMTDQCQITMEKSFTEPPALHAWRRLARLFRRSYWRRVWVQQEIMSASEVLVHYGCEELPLSLIYGTMKALKELCSRARADFGRRLEFTPMGISSASVHSGQLYIRRRQFRNLKGPSQDIDWELLCLSLQNGTQCTDPRDKIYGLIGIIDRWRNNRLTVDYNLSITEVYIQAFRSITESHSSLDIFCTQPYQSPSGRGDLPSWCPDWRAFSDGDINTISDEDFQERQEICLFRYGDDRYRSGGGRSAEIKVSVEHRELRANGFLVDTVEALSDRISNKTAWLSPEDRELWKDLISMAFKCVGGPYWSWWQTLEPTEEAKFEMGRSMIDAGSTFPTPQEENAISNSMFKAKLLPNSPAVIMRNHSMIN